MRKHFNVSFFYSLKKQITQANDRVPKKKLIPTIFWKGFYHVWNLREENRISFWWETLLTLQNILHHQAVQWKRVVSCRLIWLYSREIFFSTIPARLRVIHPLSNIYLKIFVRSVLLFYNTLTNCLLGHKTCQVFFWDVSDVALL